MPLMRIAARSRLAAFAAFACWSCAAAVALAAPSPDLRCRAALGSAAARAVRGTPDRALVGLARKCGRATAARAAFENGDPQTTLAAALAAELAASDAALLGAPPPTADRAVARCRRAVVRTRAAVAAAFVRAAAACQRVRDRDGTPLSSFDPGCAARPGPPADRAAARLERACRGLDGGRAGTCAPLPGCVADGALATARAIAAVTWGDTPGTRVAFDLTGDLGRAERFFAFPWPSDLRLRPDGRPDLTGWPLPAATAVIDIPSLRPIADRRPGFPVVPVAYFRFSSPMTALPAATVLPADPDGAILLLDVDPASSERGRLFPLVVQTPPPDEAYVPEGLLAVGAMPGTILPAGRRFAVVVRRRFGDAGGAPLGVPMPVLQLRAGGTPAGTRGAAARTLHASAWETLDRLGVPRDEVAALTVFTTGDVVQELATLAETLRARDGGGVALANVALDETHERFCELRAAVRFPQYQRGEPDFDDGGDFQLGPDGLPVKLREEVAPVVISVPRRPMPPGGFPLVVYLHGSAGLAAQVVDRGPYTSPADDAVPTPGQGPAYVLAAHGIAAAGPAMPLNPERLPDAAHRAYLNLENLGAYPFTFRQGAIEQRMLLDALAALRLDPALLAGCDGVTLPAGEPHVRLAVERVGVMGQSMGAQYANLLSAIDSRVAGVVPTGSGGLWGYVFLEARLVEVDGQLLAIRGLIPGLIGAREPLSHLHPAFGLLSVAWEPAETAAFAARIARDPLPGHPQRSLYLPISDDDPGFPSSVYAAMALASGTQQAGPAHDAGLQTVLASAGLGGIRPYPVTANLTSRTGAPYTGVVAEYDADGVKDGHYVFGQLDAVKRQYGCFFETLLAGGPAVVPAPEGLGTPCPR